MNIKQLRKLVSETIRQTLEENIVPPKQKIPSEEEARKSHEYRGFQVTPDDYMNFPILNASSKHYSTDPETDAERLIVNDYPQIYDDIDDFWSDSE